MAELIQQGGTFNISQRLDNDLSFFVTTQFDLTLYDYYAFIVPITPGSVEIPIVITPVDLLIGRLHFFISKTSIEDIPILTNKSRWYFNVNNPKQEVPPITVYTRCLLQGYFSVLGK
jgi:hypothetical protein